MEKRNELPVNIEIKARATHFQRQFALAEALADGPVQVLEQEDVFFHVVKGRLKLRIFSEQKGELIAYERPDQSGPKASSYRIFPTEAPLALKRLLAQSLEVRGIVKKRRNLFLIGETRVHLDQVDSLGAFIELEVVLAPGQNAEEGERIAHDLMRRLEIEPDTLIEQAYIDLIEAS